MPKPESQFAWNYEDLSKITGLSTNALYQHRVRKLFDPENLESLVIYLARYARQEVKERMMLNALTYPTREKRIPRPGERKRPPKRT